MYATLYQNLVLVYLRSGMIMRVKELVRVEEVEAAKSKAEMRAERRPEPGFVVEKAGRQLWSL